MDYTITPTSRSKRTPRASVSDNRSSVYQPGMHLQDLYQPFSDEFDLEESDAGMRMAPCNAANTPQKSEPTTHFQQNVVVMAMLQQQLGLLQEVLCGQNELKQWKSEMEDNYLS